MTTEQEYNDLLNELNKCKLELKYKDEIIKNKDEIIKNKDEIIKNKNEIIRRATDATTFVDCTNKTINNKLNSNNIEIIDIYKQYINKHLKYANTDIHTY